MGSSSEDQDSLSSRQRELLEFVQDCVNREGRMPSYREMASALKVSAVGTVQDHLQVLVDRGYLAREKTKSGRGLLRLAGARQAPMVTVPIVGEVAAGGMRDAFEVALGSLPLPVGQLQDRAPKPGDCYALRVSGESMIEAGIFPGDLVVVDRSAHAKSGDTVIAELNGEATLKEIRFPKRASDPVELIPHNKTMKTILVREREQLRVLGKVVAVHRYL